jgi:hypothetical protein
MIKNELFFTIKRGFGADDLDAYLVKEVLKHGWAEDRLKHAARILRILNSHVVDDKEMRQKFRDVIEYLERYELDE